MYHPSEKAEGIYPNAILYKQHYRGCSKAKNCTVSSPRTRLSLIYKKRQKQKQKNIVMTNALENANKYFHVKNLYPVKG